jgi:hypothetical protein
MCVNIHVLLFQGIVRTMETSFEILYYSSVTGITTSGRKYARLFSLNCFSQNKFDFNFYSRPNKIIHNATYRNFGGGAFIKKHSQNGSYDFTITAVNLNDGNNYGNNNKCELWTGLALQTSQMISQ